MITDNSARWLFYDCPKCGSGMTIEDKFGAFCPMRDCGWEARGEEAETFIKEGKHVHHHKLPQRYS